MAAAFPHHRVMWQYFLPILILALAILLYHPSLSPLSPPDFLRPMSSPRMTDLPELSSLSYKSDMLWGAYRAGLFFGMKTRSPKPLQTGLMWFDPDDEKSLYERKVRHMTTATEPPLQSSGWVRHNGRSYGRQVMIDGGYNMTLHMVKVGEGGEERGYGGDWAVRISVSSSREVIKQGSSHPGRKRISLVTYMSDVDKPHAPGWNVMPDRDAMDQLSEGVVLATGTSNAVGPWSFHAFDAQKGKGGGSGGGSSRLDFLALPTDGSYGYVLQAKELMLGIMYEQIDRNPTPDNFNLLLPNGATTGSDLALFQVTLNVPGTIDFVFLSHPKGADLSNVDSSEERAMKLTGKSLSDLIQEKEAEFDEKFQSEFKRAPPPSADPSSAEDEDESDKEELNPESLDEMAKVALSNVLGSLSYSYGRTTVKLPPGSRRRQGFLGLGSGGPQFSGSEFRPYFPTPMFTAVPSRKSFPFGSLWDEGFHQLIIQRWDPQLTRDVLAHWLDTMNSKGWIPKEQILDFDAQSRFYPVSSKQEELSFKDLAKHPLLFTAIAQNPNHPHPPTLLLPIRNMILQLQNTPDKSNPELELTRQFLARAWPRLDAWFKWFNSTQTGSVPSSYRWQGRNASAMLELNPRTPTSGLDDYPRASHPGSEERHLDLRCWLAYASGTVLLAGEVLGMPESTLGPYRQTHGALSDPTTLSLLHQDASGAFFDYGLHSEDVSLQKRSFPLAGRGSQDVTYRVVSQPPISTLVPSFGYVSLFPLLMKILDPNSEELDRQLKLLVDPKLLWTPNGLRSLSKSSSLYNRFNMAQSPPNWRGHIHVNINYLALEALEHYARMPGPHATSAHETYFRLRGALLSTVLSGFDQGGGAASGGHFFESYDDETGEGKSQTGLGWTALVALLV